MDRRRAAPAGPVSLVLPLVALVGVAGGCLNVATEPAPTGQGPGPASPPAPASAAALTQAPQPEPTATTYIVRRNDTLSQIAARFGLTIGQLLAANPLITDPNRIAVGQVLIIPPPGAPDVGPDTADLSDIRDDITDLEGQLQPGQSYVDITGIGASLAAGRKVLIELRLVHTPPARVDPSVEVLTYTAVVDTTGDPEPEFRVVYANDGDGDGRFVAALEDRTTGRIRSGEGFPGEVEVTERALRFRINRAALGDPARYLVAFKVERQDLASGADELAVETSVDFAPDQQWPRANPRWIQIRGG
jgi:LysM repeat protein